MHRCLRNTTDKQAAVNIPMQKWLNFNEKGNITENPEYN